VAWLVVGGCAVGPNYRTPEPCAMPATWSHVEDVGPPGPTSGPSTRPADLAQWWKALNDPMLDSLIVRAVRSNIDLRIAEARVREARGARGVVFAGLLPAVGGNASYTYRGISVNASEKSSSSSGGGFSSKLPSVTITPRQPDGEGGTRPMTITVNPPGGGSGGGTSGSSGVKVDRDSNLFQAGFDASWEIDVFGGIRREVEAADADLAAVEEDRRDVLVTLLSEVARNYVEVRGLQRRIVITQENMESERETLKLTQSRFKAGLTGELDVVRAEAQLASTTAAIPTLESALKQTIHQLGVLLGQTPESLLSELAKDAPIPANPPTVPVGLPSDLLRRRPDIRRAERQLASATAQIGVATADLFPKFSLTGSYGLQSADVDHWVDRRSTFGSITPNMQWPIFEGGRILSNIAVQNARQEQSLGLYENTVLTALKDVENALVAYAQEQVRYRELSAATKANRRALDLATELYSKGLADFLSVLDAQRALFVSEDALVQSQQTVITSLIALYKALGGGWEPESQVAAR